MNHTDSPLKSAFNNIPSPLQRYTVAVLLQSPLLRVIPKVRRLALIETILAQNSDNSIRQIFIECLADSPYIPPEAKAQFANLLFSDELPSLNILLGLPINFHHEVLQFNFPNAMERLAAFRNMIVTVFSTSKIISNLSLDRRREIGLAIQQCQTPYQLRELTISALETSQVVDEPTRGLIANDIFDGRYDQLLLSNRFDCEDLSRIFSSGDSAGGDSVVGDQLERENNECPICLMNETVNCQLPCPGQHKLCRNCVEEWANKAVGPTFSCPYCREPCRLSEVVDI